MVHHIHTPFLWSIEYGWSAGARSIWVLPDAYPYIKDGHTQCAVIARSKNHYSPGEENEFYRLNYNPVSPDPKQYHLIHWRGITFTIFNCFELTDIAHRSVFRGKVDALIAVEWNKDTDYFSNIMETTACDLHCTIIQVNTSDFGDSRIYTPYHDGYKRNIIRVKAEKIQHC